MVDSDVLGIEHELRRRGGAGPASSDTWMATDRTECMANGNT